MSRNKSLGLSAVFLAIAVFVSSSLVLALHGSYTPGSHAAMPHNAIQLLQKT